MKLHSPAAERNCEPVLAVLRSVLPATGMVLELASGSGQHAVFFAGHLPHLIWQPTDIAAEALASIDAYAAEAHLPNLRPPLKLDAAAETWPALQPDVVVSLNMIHISPWSSCEGLFRNAGKLSVPVVFLYGPFFIDGVDTAPSNLAFDQSLQQRNPAWGIRRLADVVRLAQAHGYSHELTVPMPANNASVIFRRK